MKWMRKTNLIITDDKRFIIIPLCIILCRIHFPLYSTLNYCLTNRKTFIN